MVIRASALAMDFSQSFDRRRHRPSHAKLRSTIRRRGRTSNPSAVSERLTIWTVQRPMAFRASRSFGPAYPPSAKVRPRTRPVRVSWSNAQHGIARADGLEHIRRAVTILYPGTVDLKHDQQSGRVSDDMALTPLDPLTGIITANPSTFRGFYALAVDDTGCQLRVSTLGKSARLDQLAIDFIEQTVVTPSVEVTPDRGNRREVIRQHQRNCFCGCRPLCKVSGGCAPRGIQLDGWKFQGIRSSMRLLGWPFAIASSVALR